MFEKPVQMWRVDRNVAIEDIRLVRKYLIEENTNVQNTNAHIYLKAEKKPIGVTETISELSAKLTQHLGFLKSHKEFIINIAEISDKGIRQGNNTIVSIQHFEENHTIIIAPKHREVFREMYDQFKK